MEKNYENKYFRFQDKYWWFVGRRDLFKKFISKYDYNGKILDVGCSSGTTLNYLKTSFGYGFDLSFSAIKEAKKIRSINCVVGNALAIPYKSNGFDFVIASDILEHIDNDIQVINEIKRVLKKNGKALIAVPAFNFLWGKMDEVNFHKRRYTSKELKNKLKDFKIIQLIYWNFFMFPFIFLLRKLKRKSDDLFNLGIFNNLLIYLIKFENFLIFKGFKFPFGVSLFIVIEKT